MTAGILSANRLQLQNALGRVTIVILAPLYFLALKLMGYRVRDIRAFRKACRREFAGHEGPWLFCANHLTMIDSLILAYAMFSLPDHILKYRRTPWNLPEQNNFQQNFLLTALCFLAKCIPVERCGDREKMRRSLDRCRQLLGRGQNLLIFPEGGRSRTGRVDMESFSYGVGRFVGEFSSLKILCLYLRGDRQETYSTLPAYGEKFTVDMEVFEPAHNGERGLRAQREYARQIVARLAGMEEAYFAGRQ